MRITDKMTQSATLNRLNKNRSEMDSLQGQAATLKRVTKPSDDPISSARVLQMRTEDKNYQQFQKNINTAKTFIDFTEQSLGELNEVLVRAKELAIQAASDTGGSTPRLIASAEIEQLYNQVLSVANRRLGDRYVFGGYQTKSAPFDVTGNYTGDDGDMKVQTHKDSYISMNLSGDKIFLGKGFGAEGFTGPRPEAVKNVNELIERREAQLEAKEIQEERAIKHSDLSIRGPASEGQVGATRQSDLIESSKGLNIFNVMKGLDIAMKTNDKQIIQESIESLDTVLNQVIMARSELGSRVNALNQVFDGLQKSTVDNKSFTSQLEDADMFKVVSDINKTDTTMKATLESSSKMLSQSLMDFLR